MSKTLHKPFSGTVQSHDNEMHSAVEQNCSLRLFEVRMILNVR